MESKKTKKEIVKMLLNQDLEEKDEEELLDLLVDNPIAIDVDKAEEEKMSLGDKIADKVSEIASSWGFILGSIAFLVFWVVLNTKLLAKALDPYPFILLNLVLSCVAALQAPIIMMSQNRQAKKDSMRNQNDYKTNLKSELILEELHDKLDTLLKRQKEIIKLLEEDQTEQKNSKND